MKNKKTNAGGPAQSPESPKTGSGKTGADSLLMKTNSPKQNAESSGFNSTELLQILSGKLAEAKKLFGQNLACIRKNAGYSQLALSVEVDLSHNFINDLEQGRKGASFETLVRLSVVLRTPIHQFFESPQEAPPHDDFQYPDPIDKLMIDLHETIDGWNDKRTK
jgi:transcriptional regulator with XRE-family HTH domain